MLAEYSKVRASLAMLACAAVFSVACGTTADSPQAGVSLSAESQIIDVDSSAAFDLADQKALAGWADAVFVGSVDEALGSQDLGAGFPESQFRVSVSDILKGEIPSEVIVNQAGGTDSAGNLVVVDETDLITPGGSYLFSARVFAEKGWLTIANSVGAIPLGDDAVDGPDAQSRTSEQSLIDRMRDSIANQIPVKDEGPRETVLSSTPAGTATTIPSSAGSPSAVPPTTDTLPPSSLPATSESPASVPNPGGGSATSTSTTTATPTPTR